MRGVIFHEKIGLEKKLWFPENSQFFEIHNFLQNSPKLVTPRLKFPGIWVTTRPKNTRIYAFPGIVETKFRIFPGKFLSKFLVFTKIWGRPFHEFPGILVDKTTKNAGIYEFPGILEPKSRFSPGNFYENLEFSRNFGATRHKIPGNFGHHSPRKCKNIRVSPVFGGKNHHFPGNFRRPVEISRKNVVVPQACTFKNIRVSRSPQAHILGPKKDPQKFICT